MRQCPVAKHLRSGICMLMALYGWRLSNHMFRKFEYSRVYRPEQDWQATGAEVGRPFHDFIFTAPDGVRLSAWFFPAEEDSPRRDSVLLICHGNAGNISHRVQLCRVLLRSGASVMVFDYRGYGRSEGAASEEGTYLDAQAAYRWLRQQGYAPKDIILFGESLGGGIASELALREPVGGLVLHSTFTSIAKLGGEMFPWLPVRWINTIKYDTVTKLPRLNVPLLIMHSREDEYIAFSHAEKNFAAANEPKMFLETDGGHDYTLPSSHDLCAQGMEKFLILVEATNGQTPEPQPDGRQPQNAGWRKEAGDGSAVIK
ncbi:MAG: hypothetical protein JWR26_4033 [Pedosphaera sp.]|nr:hypothetical protein [Pedosphaera sp.]